MITAAKLRRMSRSQLAALLGDGHPIEAAALDDCEYRGVSLGLPAVVERLSWKTFKKVFYRDPQSGHLRGWNQRISQRDGHGGFAYRPLLRRGAPVIFGHFRVITPATAEAFAGVGCGLLIHYGLGQHSPFDPLSRLRDPLVAVNRGSVSLLLGRSYLDVGFATVATPSFFSLERADPLKPPAAPAGV